MLQLSLRRVLYVWRVRGVMGVMEEKVVRPPAMVGDATLGGGGQARFRWLVVRRGTLFLLIMDPPPLLRIYRGRYRQTDLSVYVYRPGKGRGARSLARLH